MAHVTQQPEATEQPERMHLVKEIARTYRIDGTKVQDLFAGEPGVIVLKKKHRAHLRIPDSVLRRVLARLTVKP